VWPELRFLVAPGESPWTSFKSWKTFIGFLRESRSFFVSNCLICFLTYLNAASYAIVSQFHALPTSFLPVSQF
jgi:hypothetical protein